MLSKTKLKIASLLSMVLGLSLSQPMNSKAQTKPLQNKIFINKTAPQALGNIKSAVVLHKYTGSGVTTVPIEVVLANPAEQQKFQEWISARGWKEMTYEDVIMFRLESGLESLHKRIEALEEAK